MRPCRPRVAWRVGMRASHGLADRVGLVDRVGRWACAGRCGRAVARRLGVTKDTVAVDATLVMVRKDGRTQEVALKHERTLVGRHTDCQIRIPVAAVSRQHCELSVGSDGGLKIRDLGSSNGTYVNRERVDETELHAGDVVAVGPVLFVVRLGGEPAQIDADEAWARGDPEGGEAAASSPPQSPSSAGKPEPLLGRDDGPLGSDDSSMSDFDFDFLDDDEDDQPKL